MSLAKKMRDNQDKMVLEKMFKKKPKHRCPKCHRFSIWVPSKKGGKEPECVMCELIRRTKEEQNEVK